jgi:hypothetical protein
MLSRVPVLLSFLFLVVAVPVALVLALLSPVIGIVVGLIAGAAFVTWVWRSADASMTAGLATRRSDEATDPRLHNVLGGLCDTRGVRRPTVLVVDSNAGNGAAYGRSAATPYLLITRGALDSLSRLELEGFLARLIVPFANPQLAGATVIVPVLGLLPGGLRRAVQHRFLADQRWLRDDFDAVGVTRYPPGLRGAYVALEPRATVIPGVRAGAAHLWVTAAFEPGDVTPDNPTLGERIDALGEL